MHEASVDGPFMHGEDRFAMIFGVDSTMKETGERTKMREVGLYPFNEAGRIVREEFFY